MIKAVVLFVAALVVGGASAAADVPAMINYQGKLMQPSGAPVPDGTYQMTFAIYDVPTGGTALWSETNPSVQVKGGLFAVLLGSVTNLPANIFDSPDRWFGVTVGNDPEMTPRQKIASVGFALKASSADVASTVPDNAIITDKVADGAITAAKLAPGVAIPPGAILMWSGSVANIPQGWALCDGTNGTPDLRDRFVVGAGSGYAVGATGGAASVDLRHSHRWVYAVGEAVHGSYDATGAKHDGYGSIHFGVSTGGMNVGVWDGNQGSDWWTDKQLSSSVENRPPYYALCFIMKLGY